MPAAAEPVNLPRPDDPVVIAALLQWVADAGLTGLGVDRLIDGFCERLHDAGIRLARANISFSLLHPLIRAENRTWTPGRAAEAASFPHENVDNVAWRASPFLHMLATGKARLRRRLVGPEARLDFPVLKELAGQGLTDWYGSAFGFDDTRPEVDGRANGMVASWATDRAAGFTTAEIEALERVLPAFALAVKAVTAVNTGNVLLSTYLGADAAQRVYAGEIRRGSVQRLNAVLFYADLRGFTALADSLPTGFTVEMLDGYFDCIGLPVRDAGGQVLKFLGDGLLATFDLADRDPAEVCRSALDAADAALARTAGFNQRRTAAGLPALDLDVALHLGEVLYGNVGTADRLEFTVIGPAVNEAARMEALCRDLGRNLLVSESFHAAATDCRGRLVSLGRQQLRGVREPKEVFALARGAGPAHTALA